MNIVKTEKIKTPWDITISLNNGYLDDIDIHYNHVILRECELDEFVVSWCQKHLKCSAEVRVSYTAVNCNSAPKGLIKY